MSRESIFVFGSNEAGRHGAGAALFARKSMGAIYGQGEGLQGQSYGIPTKDARLRSLPLETICGYVMRFIQFAAAHPEMYFVVTRVGCGLAGYHDEEIGPMFNAAPANCKLPQEWDDLGVRFLSVNAAELVDVP